MHKLTFACTDTTSVLPKKVKKARTAKKVSTPIVKAELIKDEIKDEVEVDSDDADDEEDQVEQEFKNESKRAKINTDMGKVSNKRTRKQAKMERCDFLDFEAEEDDDKEERKGRRSVKFEDELYKRGKSSFVLY